MSDLARSAGGSDPRIRIDLHPSDGGTWEARVYDLSDHGRDLAHASVWGKNFDRVLQLANQYARVAVADGPVLSEPGTVRR